MTLFPASAIMYCEGPEAIILGWLNNAAVAGPSANPATPTPARVETSPRRDTQLLAPEAADAEHELYVLVIDDVP